MTNFVVKVQLSLATSLNTRQCLIYNRDKSLAQEFPASKEILRAMGNHDKRYFNASFDNGKLTINKPVKDQPW